MKRDQFQPSEQLAEFLKLIRTGQLFKVQARIHEVEPEVLLDESIPAKFSPLLQAVETGFHSMVEVVLKCGRWGKESLNQALSVALETKRWDLAELLIDQGASLSEIDFGEVCRTVNPELMEKALRGGADPAARNTFAFALDEIKARPLLRFIRELKDEYPVLCTQASLALIEAVQNKKARWAALLKWAGADPYMNVPYELTEEEWNPEDSDFGTTAAEQACAIGDFELFKALNLRPTPEQAKDLLERTAFSCSLEIMKEIMRHMPKECINFGNPPTCAALEHLLKYFPNSSDSYYRYSRSEDQVVECMEFLLDRGARWHPTLEDIAYLRRTLMRLPSRSISKALRPIVYTPSAASPEMLKELCRTPRIRSKISAADRDLLRDIDAM
jgi:hypothetical protein